MKNDDSNDIKFNGRYDVIVVGGGHAGCEAAHASAKMGMKTLLLTLNADNIALMPCNPSIGGPGKGHIVREIDALGGLMGRVIDDSYIQIRVLNDSRGPAVRALRAQADKKKYQHGMKLLLESQENLSIKMDEAVKLLASKNDSAVSDSASYAVAGVETKNGLRYGARSVVLCTGVYLKSDIIIGSIKYSGGPHNEISADELSGSLASYGFRIERLQTATPCRVNRSTIDFSRFRALPYSVGIKCFSFEGALSREKQEDCYLAFSNEKTVEIIKNNIHRSPLVIGNITNVGPRYCPSIDRKVINFPNKAQHQIFIEPEGEDSNEMYLQGLTTSMPPDVQLAILRSVPGLENVEVMRFGYAIEYDFMPPDQLRPTLETKLMEGLFCAGQINGTSGYEEAAGQGIVAGMNAVLKLEKRRQLVLSRSSSYIGVMIDDLVTKPLIEPYRVFTSRAEHRLVLGGESAHFRLSGIGRRLGLLPDEAYKRIRARKKTAADEFKKLRSFKVNPTGAVNEALAGLGEAPIRKQVSAFDILKREKVGYADLSIFGFSCAISATDDPDVVELIEIFVKYSGYVERELVQIEKFKKIEKLMIPRNFDFGTVSGLSKESRDVLGRFRPENLGQASRLQGVTPSEISLLMVYLAARRGQVPKRDSNVDGGSDAVEKRGDAE